MLKQLINKQDRLVALDYLRGFFIIVIIIDHLNRWPSLLELLTGRNELWASAAEGFVIISGLMLGYIRGFKARDQSFQHVSVIVLKRALMLYIWAVLCTVVLSAATWYLTFQGPIAYVPIPVGDWSTLVYKSLTFEYVHVLPYFLYLYAMFLAVSPLMIWLLRKNLWWIVVVGSIAAWMIGIAYSVKALQWFPVFFIPGVVGYYLEPVRRWVRLVSRRTKYIAGALIVSVTLASMVFSSLEISSYLEPFFGRSPLELSRIGVAFVWFIGLLILFQFLLPWLKRWLGWLLEVFGTRSLTAYIIQSVPLMLCALFIASSDNYWLNTLLGVACILVTWGLVKLPFIQNVIPR